MDEEIKKRWSEAYKANPRVYEKDGTLMVGFALTEDTDSLFPLYPEKQWDIPGKTISMWMISFVTVVTQPGKKNPTGNVEGMVDYHEAMKRLEPYFIAYGDDWRLIRALTKAEIISVATGEPVKPEKHGLFGLFGKK